MPFGLGTGFGIGVELPLSELELELNCKNEIDPSSEWHVSELYLQRHSHTLVSDCLISDWLITMSALGGTIDLTILSL